jgi:uncharacterized membrane protein YphA (DoxX/SURF4 family)
MIKTILLILLGLFFILNGLNHLFNRLTLEEYAHRRGLVSPRIMVFLSGLLLIFGGLSLMTGYFQLYASWGCRYSWLWLPSPSTNSGWSGTETCKCWRGCIT